MIRYKDAAVLHYQFISEEWNKPSWNVYLELYPPIPLSKQEVQVWSHGPLWMGSYIQEDGTITGSCKKLPAYTYFDIRALYPLEVFSESRYVNQAVKENILQQEARWAKEANQKRETLIAEDQARKKRWAQGKWIMGVLTLIGFIGWWSLHRRYGIRSSLKLPVPKISPNIPSDTPPALLDYLLHDRQIYGGALMGTLFDLARRGILNLRHEEREVKGFKRLFKEKSTQYWDIKRDVWEKKAAQLTEYENSILEFLFDTIGQGKDSIEIKLIQKKRTAFMKFFREWKKEVKRRAEEREWFDKQSLKGRNYSLILSCVMLLLLIPGCILYGPWGLLLAFSSLILFILSLFIAHRTSKGEQLFREWKSLKKYLIKHHYRYADKQHVLDQIDDYLIYGTVLGLTQKMFKELADFIPSDNHASYLPWFIYHGRPGAAFSSASFAASFSTSVAATTSAMSSASGAGGGASGGAGGASSGGGGAG